MYQHYPEYCAAPYEMMTWLRGQAAARERAYAPPGRGGVRTGGAGDEGSDEEAELPRGPERGFGPLSQKHMQDSKKEEKARQAK